MDLTLTSNGVHSGDAPPPPVPHIPVPTTNDVARREALLIRTADNLFATYEPLAAADGAAGNPSTFADSYGRELELAAAFRKQILALVADLRLNVKRSKERVKNARTAYSASETGQLEMRIADHEQEYARAAIRAGRAPGATDGYKPFMLSFYLVLAALGALVMLELFTNAAAFDLLSQGDSTARWALAVSACTVVASAGHFVGYFFKRKNYLAATFATLFLIVMAIIIGYYRGLGVESSGGAFGSAATSEGTFDLLLAGLSFAITLGIGTLAACIGYFHIDSEPAYHDLLIEHHKELPAWKNRLAKVTEAEARLEAAGDTSSSASLRKDIERYGDLLIQFEDAVETIEKVATDTHTQLIARIRKANVDARTSAAPIPSVLTGPIAPLNL